MRALAPMKVASLALLLIVGCGDDGATPPDGPVPDAVPMVEQVIPTALDVLFVVEDAGSQDLFVWPVLAGLPEFVAGLDTIPGGRPQLHVGVISSSVGTNPFELDGCPLDGDDGRLLNVPRVLDCVPPSGYFVSYERDEDGAERTNYSTSIEETLTCIGRLALGCGLEQHLESMRRALDGHRPENQGFVRSSARLAIVFIAEEDDCSATDGSLFDPEAKELGALTSYRCFEYGVLCGGEHPPRERATLTDCVGVETAYERGPDEYVRFLETLKPSPSWITVGGVMGDRDGVSVHLNDDGSAVLSTDEPCELSLYGPRPAVRLGTLIDAMPSRIVPDTTCAWPGDKLGPVGQGLAKAHGEPCLEGDVDPEGCRSDEPFTLVPAAERCGAYPTGLAVRFERTGPAFGPSTITCPQRAR